MQTLFEAGAELPFWAPCAASVTQLVATANWPLTIAAVGLAPCVRAWTGADKGSSDFRPVPQLQEVDGQRFISVAATDGLLVAADASSTGRIGIWDIKSWERVQALEAGAEISCLAVSTGHIAAGTVAGYVRVWRRQGTSGEFLPLFDPDLNLDEHPLYSVLLGPAPDGKALLVVHSLGKNRIGVWRLDNGRLVHTLGLPGDPTSPVAVVAANVVHSFLLQGVLALVSWMEGRQPVVQLVDVLSRQGSIVDAPDRLVGRGRPLCADFDGVTLAVGFDDGALCVFGYKGWLRRLPGAVGAVRIINGSDSELLLSGSADETLCLWNLDGHQLQQLPLHFQPTSLALIGDTGSAVAGHGGQVQVVVWSQDELAALAAEKVQAQGVGGTVATELENAAAEDKHDGGGNAAVMQYRLQYDARVPWADASASGDVASASCSDYQRFVRPRVTITAEDLAGVTPAAPPAALQESGVKAGGCTNGASSSASSGQLAKELPADQDVDESAAAQARKAAQRQMGEGSGVARNPGVQLACSSADMGRKCDNHTCLVREGLGITAFKRCGACKQRSYCSAHCQRTHWRDGHSKECPRLKAGGS